ncbi:MAG: hypothetical protein ACJARF_002594, partial [Alteromonadaceae bacterium]
AYIASLSLNYDFSQKRVCRVKRNLVFEVTRHLYDAFS